jgi:hypothetical protein
VLDIKAYIEQIRQMNTECVERALEKAATWQIVKHTGE